MVGNIQMVDLKGQYETRKQEFDSAINSVIESTAFINGPDVKALQFELEEYLQVKHAVTCANGTDALTIALWALGLESGDEVITSDFTFIATAEAIARVGLKPVLVDVNPDTFTIDVDQIEAAITDRTKVIMPVHLFGQAADMNSIMDIAEKHNLFVIEDGAQCFGADMNFRGKKKKLNSIGHIATTSFFPSKNLGCFGDGGAMFTNDDELDSKLRKIANHGSQKKYFHSIIGVNSRLDTIQAAILRVKLKYIDEYNTARFNAAMLYNEKLADINWINTPAIDVNSEHVFHQYTLKLNGVLNTQLQEFLKEKGIPSMIYYPVSMSKQEALSEFSPSDCPISNQLTQEVLSLPIHTQITEEQINYICDSIRSFK